MNEIIQYYKSSIGKKQIVATTGLLLILFIIGHLAGNLLIYLGPDAFNNYAKKLASLRPGLYVIETFLLLMFLVHMYLTALLVLENIKARGQAYKVEKTEKDRSLASIIMPYTGTIVVIFVVWHILDFTFVDHLGPRSILKDGNSYGLYGVVYNAFSEPSHTFLYIVAMFALGLHLSHGVQSFLQTFGLNQPHTMPLIKNCSDAFALLIAISYSAIPLYILFFHPQG